MKNHIIIILCIVGLGACTHTVTIVSEKQLTDDIFYLPDATKPYTGKCIINYKGTHITKELLSFRKGILNGSVIGYYENSKIKRKGEYLDGRFHGKWEYWDIKGNKSYEVNYKNDSLCGEYITWYPGGKILEKGSYLKNKRAGKWVMYDQNGSILKENKYDIN
jgi:antitoxin component YwqK of YwqJK toxin-antitoxin module